MSPSCLPPCLPVPACLPAYIYTYIHACTHIHACLPTNIHCYLSPYADIPNSMERCVACDSMQCTNRHAHDDSPAGVVAIPYRGAMETFGRIRWQETVSCNREVSISFFLETQTRWHPEFQRKLTKNPRATLEGKSQGSAVFNNQFFRLKSTLFKRHDTEL